MKNNLTCCADSNLVSALTFSFIHYEKGEHTSGSPLFNTNKLNYSIEVTGKKKKRLKTVFSYFTHLLIIKETCSPITADVYMTLVERELKGEVTFLKE